MCGMISAIILTRNSGDHINHTLESLLWCDELLVIDDYSSDKTREIAGSFKATVFVRHLNNDFAAQRNFALSKAKGDWILFVDSDEVVSGELASEIKKSISIDCAGFYIKRSDWMFGKQLMFGETGRTKLLRLARKGTGIWTRTVHEVWNVQGIVGTLEHPLYHYPHPNVAQFVSEINLYSTLNARYLYAQGIKVPWWHILAYPAAKFFIDYFWFMGFRDGTAGAVVALMMSMHSFLTRAKLWILWNKHRYSFN